MTICPPLRLLRSWMKLTDKLMIRSVRPDVEEEAEVGKKDQRASCTAGKTKDSTLSLPLSKYLYSAQNAYLNLFLHLRWQM